MKTALVSRFRLAATLCLLAFTTPALAVNLGDIVTVAGTGSAGFSGDNVAATSADLYQPTGAAFDSAGNLYIADSYNYRVRKVDVTTNIISTVAGNGTGIFTGGNVSATSTGVCPQSLALDGANNLYIVDICSQRI